MQPKFKVGDKVRFTEERIRKGFSSCPDPTKKGTVFTVDRIYSRNECIFVGLYDVKYSDYSNSFGWKESSLKLVERHCINIDSITSEI